MARTKESDSSAPAKTGRLSQIRQAYTMTRKADRWVGFVTFGFFMIGWGAVVAIGFLVKQPTYFAILGVMVGALLGVIMFGRRVERAAYAQFEGQQGAAAAVLQNARGWTVTPAVAANKSQDLLHRAVGRGGIVLLGEGEPHRVAGLIATERKRLNRMVPDAPVTEFLVGDGPGQVPLRKLSKKVQRLKRVLRPAEVTEIRNRLNALGSLMDQMPVPKGPMPKGGRPKRR